MREEAEPDDGMVVAPIVLRIENLLMSAVLRTPEHYFQDSG